MRPPASERGSAAQPRKDVAAAPASAELNVLRSMAAAQNEKNSMRANPRSSRCLGPPCARPPGRLALDLAAGDARGVLELAPEREEGVAQGEVGILVVAAARYELLARDAQVDAHVKKTAPAAVPAQFLDVDPAAHDARVKFLELLRDFPDLRLERRRVREVEDGNLKGYSHGRSTRWLITSLL